MSSRETVLGSIRRSLGVNGQEPLRHDTVNDRLGRHPRGIIPERGNLSGKALVNLFRDKVVASAASVEQVESAAEVPQAVAAYLRANNLPAAVRHGEDARFGAMPWAATSIERKSGPSDGHDLVGLSYATGGVAETGTLVLTSGRDNPTTVNFLPDDHIIVIDAASIAGAYEDVLARIRSQAGFHPLPRTINMITGPSRSGDIEQKLLFGAHGPRRVHVIVVG